MIFGPLTKKPQKQRPKKIITPSHSISAQGIVTLIVPIITTSEANSREHWHKKALRHTKQKQIFKLYYTQVKNLITLPCIVTFTRLAPRMLDEKDNMPMSMKYIIDSVCEELTGNYIAGRADSDPRITLHCRQEKSKEYGVKIQFDCNPYHT